MLLDSLRSQGPAGPPVWTLYNCFTAKGATLVHNLSLALSISASDCAGASLKAGWMASGPIITDLQSD